MGNTLAVHADAHHPDATSADDAAATPRAPDEPVRVLVVDDDRAVREMVAETLDGDPRITVVARAHDGAEALRLADELELDVVVMDVHMPQMDGPDATERILGAHPRVQVVALTGTVDPETVTRMVLAGAVGYAVKGGDPQRLADAVVGAAHRGYFVDPSAVDDLFESVVLLAREERRRRAEAERLAEELKRAYRETVTALVNALRSRDGDTEAHGDRVAERVVAVARRLGLEEKQVSEAEYGAVFHDIGKIAVPDAILHNTDDLTDAEWAVIRQHTVIGERIISPVAILRNVARIVRHSHEHWNGSGYPDQLVGEDIPIESRIVFACDAFDAMTTTRSYQEAMSHEAAIDRMLELRGVNFDPQVVDALVAVLEDERAAPAPPRPPDPLPVSAVARGIDPIC
ncbi:MAG: response regulator receiver modulated metal dependent phosphohydrolase [Thermoleophilia bacterium]|nr:response regulator receiver modulated metal dependent phosphohydrolase [Thermoleophilia bacterium]